MKTAKEIVYHYTKGGLPTRPEASYGRGNNGDINSEILEQIYKGVTNEIGKEAAVSYVSMVETLTEQNDMSATTFLTALYHMEAKGWKFTKEVIPASDDDAVAEAFMNASRKGEDITQAVTTGMMIKQMASSDNYMFAALTWSGEFLDNHRKELKRPLTAVRGKGAYVIFG